MCHLINMCNELGMFCIAEGVETEDQADALSSMGLACIQGYIWIFHYYLSNAKFLFHS